VRAGATERVVIEAPPVSPPVGPPPPSQPVQPPPSPPEPVRETTSTTTILGVGSLGLAAIGTGAAIFFGVRTLNARDEYESSGFTSPDSRESALQNRTLTNVSLVAVGVFAVTGIVLLLTRSDGPKASAVR
jgi:hypothetical protein